MALLLRAGVFFLAILLVSVQGSGCVGNAPKFVGNGMIYQGEATAGSDEWVAILMPSLWLSITPSLASTSMFLSLSCLVHRMQTLNALSFTRNHQSEMELGCALHWPSVGLLAMLQGVDGYTQSAPKFVGTGASGSGQQGMAAAVSGDGRTACVGGQSDSGNTGAVWMWTLSNPMNYSSWAQQGSKLVPKDNTGAAYFGLACSLNSNGSIAVIGGYYNSNSLGSTWVFTRNATGWFQQGGKYIGTPYIYVAGIYVNQGYAVSLAPTAANTFVTGGYQDNSGAGAFWIFTTSGNGWAQNGGKMVGSGGSSSANLGIAVSISADASTIAVGAWQQTGGGAVWVFTINATLQYQQQGSYFTASPASSQFGFSVALSANGNTLAVGAYADSSSVGAMFAFTRTGGAWAQIGVKHVGSGYVGQPQQGASISISGNGNVIAIGGYGDNGDIGAVWVWVRNSTCPSFCQYGSKLVGLGYSGSPYQGNFNSLSVSSDASVLLAGGYFDNSHAGAFWAFNDTLIPFLSASSTCSIPSDTASMIYSGSCPNPTMPSGSWCTPQCASSYFNAGGSFTTITCVNGQLSTCTDHTLNGLETSVDCGGPVCPACINEPSGGYLNVTGSTVFTSVPKTAALRFTNRSYTIEVKVKLLGSVSGGNPFYACAVCDLNIVNTTVGGSGIAIDRSNNWAAILSPGKQIGYAIAISPMSSFASGATTLGIIEDGTLGPLSLNTWYSLAFVSQADASGVISPALYQDGVLVYGGQGGGISFGTVMNIDNNLPFGIGQDGTLAATSSNFTNIQIDEVRIWQTARSQADIVSAMCADVTGHPDLLVYYQFNNATSTVQQNMGSLGGTYTVPSASSIVAGGEACVLTTSTYSPTANCLPDPCNTPNDTNSTIYSTQCGSNVTSGSACVPVCNNGYTATASLQITCTAGVFSTPVGVCNPNPCNQLPDTANETFSACGATTASGSVCTPACKSGYSPTASISIQCALGNFSSPVGYCAANPCVAFPNAPNTVYSSCSAPVSSSSTCTPTCQGGYSPVGDITIICLAGVFQPSTGSCQPSPCPQPTVSFPNTTGSCPSSISSGTSCSLGCASGYVANGSLSVTCTNGVLSAPSGSCQLNTNSDCSAPTPPYPLTSGNCPPSSPNGTVCSLSCSSGFAPSVNGDFSAICNNQTFIISSTAVCVPNQCATSSLVLTAGLNTGNCPAQTPENTTCVLACSPGYTTVGSLAVLCNVGQFSSITGFCSPNPCNPPFVSAASAMVVPPSCLASQTPSGSSCTFQCIPDFTALGSLTVICSLGNFSQVASLGSCVGVANIATTATSLTSPGGLVASAGSTITITLAAQGNPPADMVVTQYSVTYNTNVYYSASAMPDLGLTTTVTATIQVYVQCPSLGLTTDTLLSAFPPANVLFMPTPVLKSVCPDKILAQSNQTVVVQASGYVVGSPIKCILNGTLAFPATLSNSQTVSCDLIWPDPAPGQIITLNVANDGSLSVFQTQVGLNITIQGACDSQKPGSFPGISVVGVSGCICPAGSFDNGAACQLCANGYYQDTAGTTSCKPCSNNEDTNGVTGSTSAAACVCSAGNFRDPRTATCVHCLPGMYCPGNNVVDIEPGYWRASSNTVKVLPCPGSAISCIGTNNKSSSLCANGYTGPICTVCTPGYASLGTTCVQCPKFGFDLFALVVLIFCAFGFAYLLIRAASSFEDDGSTSSAEKAEKQRQGSIEVIVKIALNYTQVLYYIGRLTSNWSDLVHRFFSAVGILSALSANNYTIHCAANWRFYDSLVVMYVSPVIVVSILTVVYFFRHFIRRLDFKKTMTDYQLAVMLILYQIHPTIMLEVINSFPCEHVGGTHTSYLKEDMSVDCRSAQYKTYAALSAVYLIVYIFGMLVLTFLRLRHNYKVGKLSSPSHYAFVKYSFFFVGYRSHTYYWEAVIMVRKMGVVAFSVLPSAMLQLVFANVIIMIALHLNAVYIPFASHFINRTESLCLIALLATITLGFLFINAGSSTNTSTLWISILVILVNTATAAFLLVVFFGRMRDVLRRIVKRLPDWLRFGDDLDDVKFTKNPRALTRATAQDMELASY